ncbi:MAG: NUDIX domain-containing protein [Caulobacteraceae bacterium]
MTGPGLEDGDGALQFGVRIGGQDYPYRPAAFGVALRDGKLAAVKVTRPGEQPYFDLPGGGIDPGETPQAAVVREFGEETGLVVCARRLLGRANQYMVKSDGVPANNISTLMEVEVTGEAQLLKIEDDHDLVWLEPLEAITRLRHESHAWAVAAWLRMRG